MAVIKIKRGDEEMQIEESEIQDGDERMETQPEKDEKKFTQKELNAFLAKEKKTWQTKFDSLKAEHDTMLAEIEAEKTKREEQLKTKLQEMKKNLAPAIVSAVEAIEEFSVERAIAYLEKDENKIERKRVAPTPQGNDGDGEVKQKPIGTIF